MTSWEEESSAGGDGRVGGETPAVHLYTWHGKTHPDSLHLSHCLMLPDLRCPGKECFGKGGTGEGGNETSAEAFISTLRHGTARHLLLHRMRVM